MHDQPLRTNSVRRTSPFMDSCRQSNSSAMSVRRIDRIAVLCLSVRPAPFTGRFLVLVAYPYAAVMFCAPRTNPVMLSASTARPMCASIVEAAAKQTSGSIRRRCGGVGHPGSFQWFSECIQTLAGLTFGFAAV